MGARPELQTILEALQEGVSVYFQPPSNVQMTYPAIVYNRDFLYVARADNSSYSNKKRYQVTVIDQDPDSLIPDKVADLPMATFVRWFATDNLNHDVYDVYF